MTSRKPLSLAVHRALYSVAIASAAASAPGLAQEPEGPPEELEEITVTGSRIATDPNLISASPITQVTAEEFTYRGITRVEDLVNDLPQMVPAASAFDSNGASGTATLDLRGLGPARTLVLVNGHRMGFGDPFALSPDINQIPGALVEQVEILTGGASSTYGSDAVAGVVNFIMKDDFEGFQLGAQYSFYQHSNDTHQGIIDAINARNFDLPDDSVTDGGTTTLSAILGVNTPDGRGNITAYATYRDIEAVKQSERDFSACALNDTDDNSFECGGSSTLARGSIRNFTDSFFVIENNQFVPFDGQFFNYAPYNYYQRTDERFTGGFFGHYEVTDHVEGYAEFMFMDDHSPSQIAPSGAFFVTSEIPCSNPFLSAQQRNAIGCTSLTDVAAPWYIGRRNVEGGPRRNDLRHTSFRTLVGLRGDLNDNWSYDVYGNFSRLAYASTYLNDMSITKIQRALDVIPDPATGEPVCRAVVTGVDPACVPWNIFQPNMVTEAVQDYLILPLFSRADLEMDNYVGFVQGDLTDMGLVSPWADDGVEMVLGASYQDQLFDFNVGTGFATGDGAGQGGPTAAVEGTLDVMEYFTEFRIPVAQDRPWVEDLALELRYRYSDYSIDIQADTYYAGGSWIPTEGIKFRGGYSRAVRAPNIRELFAPQNAGLWGGNDPCAGPNPALTQEQCANTGVLPADYGSVPVSPAQQYNGIFGGNPALGEETADSITVGAVFTPSELVPGLSFSVDYWTIEVEDAISAVDPELIIKQCALTGDPGLCAQIDRGPNGNVWIGTAAVTSTQINIGFFEVAGVDLNVNYGFEIGDYGGLDLSYRGMVQTKFDEEQVPGVVIECAGFYGGSCGRPQPEYKHIVNAVWRTPVEGLQAIVGWRYTGAVDAFDEALPNPQPDVDAEQYLDLSATYQLDWFGEENSTQINAGMTNVLDNDPPVNAFLASTPFGNGNTTPGVYDTLGRYWFLGLEHHF